MRKSPNRGKAQLEFILKGGAYSVRISEAGKDCTEVEIPAEYNHLPVTSIQEKAFYHCSSLTSVTIPKSVTSIGYGVFA